jgi:hypothetical protein
MKSHSVEPGRKATGAETGHHSGFPRMTNEPSAPHGVRILSRMTFRVLRETFSAITLVTDPEKVRETLGVLESEPGK